jgi:hypothetical protein
MSDDGATSAAGAAEWQPPTWKELFFTFVQAGAIPQQTAAWCFREQELEGKVPEWQQLVLEAFCHYSIFRPNKGGLGAQMTDDVGRQLYQKLSAVELAFLFEAERSAG